MFVPTWSAVTRLTDPKPGFSADVITNSRLFQAHLRPLIWWTTPDILCSFYGRLHLNSFSPKIQVSSRFCLLKSNLPTNSLGTLLFQPEHWSTTTWLLIVQSNHRREVTWPVTQGPASLDRVSDRAGLAALITASQEYRYESPSII